MKKIISLIVGCLLTSSIYASECGEIKITGVIDGDTLRAEMPALPDQLKKVSIRIMGVDTPEIHGKCENEKNRANEAKNFLIKKFNETKNISYRWLEWDKYGGRILAEVFFDGKDIGQMMIDTGYAVPYHGEKKQQIWCSITK